MPPTTTSDIVLLLPGGMEPKQDRVQVHQSAGCAAWPQPTGPSGYRTTDLDAAAPWEPSNCVNTERECAWSSRMSTTQREPIGEQAGRPAPRSVRLVAGVSGRPRLGVSVVLLLTVMVWRSLIGAGAIEWPAVSNFPACHSRWSRSVISISPAFGDLMRR